MGRVIVLLGGLPGSGKGTQVRLLREKHAFDVLSSGDLLRSEIAASSSLGERIQGNMARGEIIPDDAVVELFASKLAAHSSLLPVLIDGFPRTAVQFDLLRHIALGAGDNLAVFAYLSVSIDELSVRLAARRLCSRCGHIYNLRTFPPLVADICDIDGAALIQRADDRPELLARRLSAIAREEKQLLDRAKSSGLLREIDGARGVSVVFADLLNSVEHWL